MSNEIKEISFYNDTITAIKHENGKIYASVNHICKNLGMDKHHIRHQRNKITSDKVLEKGCQFINTPTEGGHQDTFCIELDYLPLWLAKINVNVIKDDKTKQKLIEYQLHAKDVLAREFLFLFGNYSLGKLREQLNSVNSTINRMSQTLQFELFPDIVKKPGQYIEENSRCSTTVPRKRKNYFKSYVTRVYNMSISDFFRKIIYTISDLEMEIKDMYFNSGDIDIDFFLGDEGGY